MAAPDRMHTLESNHNPVDNHKFNAIPLNVLLLYEDIFTCLRAWHVLDLVSRHMEKRNLPIHLGANVWRFENLAAPALREQSMNESEDVDLLILAAHGNQELPQPTKEWLQQWVGLQRAEARALVVSLDSQVAELPLSFAQQIVQGTGVKIFPHWAGASLDVEGAASWRSAPAPPPHEPGSDSRNSATL